MPPYWLFTLGLIGTGSLGVPVLAGSSAYAIAELPLGADLWRRSRVEHGASTPCLLAMIGGLAIDFLGFDAVKMMFWSAVVNGALAPPLILLVVLLTSDRRVMGERINSPLLRVVGWIAFVFMTRATIVMRAS